VLTGIKLVAIARWFSHAQDDASDRKEPRGAFRQNRWFMGRAGRTVRWLSDAVYLFPQPEARARLVGREIPYAEMERRGAGMYRGIARGKQAMADPQSAQRRGSGDRHAPFGRR
jgi:hypothetical protein